LLSPYIYKNLFFNTLFNLNRIIFGSGKKQSDKNYVLEIIKFYYCHAELAAKQGELVSRSFMPLLGVSASIRFGL
jgi:hypothetical protein